MPVVCCGLHSQLAPVCAGSGRACGSPMSQLGGGALPGGALGHGAGAEDPAAARDGDRGCSVPRRRRAGCVTDRLRARLGEGEGVRRRRLRRSARASSAPDPTSVTAAWRSPTRPMPRPRSAGRAIVAVRYSDGDTRERHRGVSHHTRAALRLILGAREVAWPWGLDRDASLGEAIEVDCQGWEDACSGLSLSHMGRGPSDDPWFFAAAFAAGRHARARIR